MRNFFHFPPNLRIQTKRIDANDNNNNKGRIDDDDDVDGQSAWPLRN